LRKTKSVAKDANLLRKTCFIAKVAKDDICCERCERRERRERREVGWESPTFFGREEGEHRASIGQLIATALPGVPETQQFLCWVSETWFFTSSVCN